MKYCFRSLFTVILILFIAADLFGQLRKNSFEFYSGTFNFDYDSTVNVMYDASLSEETITSFYKTLNEGNYQPIIKALSIYKEKYKLNDWLFYQLIRKTAQQISPKAANYYRYTLYKWFFLSKSGYDARLTINKDKLLFYVRSEEDISDIPFYMNNGKQYVCLNIHDYKYVNLNKEELFPLKIEMPEAKKSFSYKVTRIPDFKPEDYTVKYLKFNYKQKEYFFEVKLNPQIQAIFANYPGVNFESYFNIPLSQETYSSLIPILKKNINKMSQKKGVDYLMRFTRYAFLYQEDIENFGREKRLSPEQTLFNEKSDCDDRAALFFYLVKEIYNLPMIAMLYPTHITMAVNFDKPMGKSIAYKGKVYSVCEPTPQLHDLRIGQLSSNLRNTPYEVVYEYDPLNK